MLESGNLMAHYDFRKDIEDGEQGEAEILHLLSERFGGILIGDNKTNSHDLIVEFEDSPFGKGQRSFEIKTDVLVTKERDTGNLFIEYASRGKKSGVLTSKAEWFGYYLRNLGEVWFIRTAELIEVLKREKPPKVEGGDAGSFTKGRLLKKSEYRKYFLVMETR